MRVGHVGQYSENIRYAEVRLLHDAFVIMTGIGEHCM